MSIETLAGDINRLQRELADLEKKIAGEMKRENGRAERILSIEGSIGPNTSISTLRTKGREINRLRKEIGRIQLKKAELSKKHANKASQLSRYQGQLRKEEERERRRVKDLEKREQQQRLEYERRIRMEIEQRARLAHQIESSEESQGHRTSLEYDFFISHASEDKEEVARPLADYLTKKGATVWYDDFSLKVGDSLRRSIDHGLSKSSYGVVILSSTFFQKHWPQYELDGLITKEMRGVKVILPIWHKVSRDEVAAYSYSLADKIALNTSLMSIEEIVEELVQLVNNGK